MKKLKSHFEFINYKSLMLWRIEESPFRGRGLRAALSKSIKVQSAYLSRVLNGDADLNLEQADAANSFFGHNSEEARYFLLLVEKARASTDSLKAHFDREISRILHERERISLVGDTPVQKFLSLEDQLTYYSSWQYSAVHIALSVPELQSPLALSKELKVPSVRIEVILEFLVRTGMAVKLGIQYTIGKVWIHLPPESPLIGKHHANWRVRAIQSSESVSRDNFHYTQVVSISREDSKRILGIVSQIVERANEIIRPSKEENLRCLAIDFFSLT